MTRRPRLSAGVPRLDQVAAVYRCARDEARRRPVWWLRRRVRRWDRVAACGGLDDLDQARRAAVDAELRARLLAEAPRGLP